jgi:type II secretory pathway pseudopilin PulG
MSGGISLSTIAAWSAIVGGAAAVGPTAYGIVNGQQQEANQKKSLAAQNQAQQEAKANALSTERKSEEAQNAANQKTPDITAILRRAAAMGSNGLSSTMLTGPGGVAPSNLTLGKTSLLGS